MLEAVEHYLADHADRFVEELKDFLRIASISADSAYRGEMEKAAGFVCDQLADCGLQAEIIPTAGHPIVYGEWTAADAAPTVLVYGHYDVQPPDPLDLWTTPPFDPQVRDGRLYARGATDDKGQMFTHVKAVEAWMKTHGKLPVNVKFVIEGEEEVSGENLDQFLAENHEKCRCDVAVISDTSQYADGIPAITYGLRGIVTCEVTLTGPNRDLHSGVYGGSVTNPVNALCRLIASLQEANGRIRVPGFYDDVTPLTGEERAQFAELPFDEQVYCRELGIDAIYGEEGFSTLERRWARPTCDVNGIIGGYTGEGPKTIVPSRASAKISCRLVPDQDPESIIAALERHLRDNLPPGATIALERHGDAPAFVCDTSSPYMASARHAISRAFGREPVMIREGGSIPVVGTLKRELGVDTLLLGWGRNSDNLHSPDEHFHLEDFHKGAMASAAFLGQIA